MDDIRTALLTVLDQVDYLAGNCRMNEMVGAVLPKEVIILAREALVSQPVVKVAACCKAPQLRWNTDHTKWVCIFCGTKGPA